MEVRFYAIGQRLIEDDDEFGYLPGTEDHENPVQPALIEVAEQEFGYILTKSEIEAQFQTIAATEQVRQFNQLCVVWHGKIIAVQTITNDPQAPKELTWSLHQTQA